MEAELLFMTQPGGHRGTSTGGSTQLPPSRRRMAISRPAPKLTEQQSPVFLAPGDNFVEDSFPTNGAGGWFQDDSST